MTSSSRDHGPGGTSTLRPVQSDKRAPAAGTSPSPPHGREAAETAHRRNSTHLSLPVFGDVTLPSTDQLAFIAGLGALAAFEIIEWPVAVILGVGHALALDHRHRLLADFGEALEEG